jgi:hypothetical protein
MARQWHDEPLRFRPLTRLALTFGRAGTSYPEGMWRRVVWRHTGPGTDQKHVTKNFSMLAVVSPVRLLVVVCARKWIISDPIAVPSAE